MEGYFPEYFYRRCFARVYIDAAKVSAALQQYHTEFDELPDQLSQLIPKYIAEIPKDAFDGKPLRYSKENEWIYSVGMNLTDDGGSEAGYYDGKCYEGASCYNNPTVSIYPLEYQEDDYLVEENNDGNSGECTGNIDE
ncbi:hypothetical protein [Spartinivicinus poritis]|uniref:Uncharacterized protein n=1 Tax=Spartinivicinus poritis TaxID=2994640 RepID=A0ABT5UB06_9GAMM|nr:hypothetical protein [Spartinivicinus sp. A2-2]MDE1463553.1 hypothetical protein [Spartinivicinus sp. A2-2]